MWKYCCFVLICLSQQPRTDDKIAAVNVALHYRTRLSGSVIESSCSPCSGPPGVAAASSHLASQFGSTVAAGADLRMAHVILRERTHIFTSSRQSVCTKGGGLPPWMPGLSRGLCLCLTETSACIACRASPPDIHSLLNLPRLTAAVMMLHTGLAMASCPLHVAVVPRGRIRASVRPAATSSQTGQRKARWHKLIP